MSQRFDASVDHAARLDDEPDRDEHRGERVEQVFLSGIFSLETAAIELEAIAALRPRVSDPVRHIVLSYDTARGERPSWEEIDHDVRTLLRQRGFTDSTDRSQRHHGTAAARFEAARKGEVSPYVAIVHGDTDSKHVHIIVSTVAPNGAVNSDFRRYGTNEHAAAMVAQAHGWEIVAGRVNGRLVAEQARSRGASEAEIEALLRRDAVTLDRLRERDETGARQSGTARGDAGGVLRRGGFISEYGEAIRDAFASSGSFDEFNDALREIGVVAKYSEGVHRKTGRVLPRLAFADALDKAGDSGSRVGVAARTLIEKFGPVGIGARTSIAATATRAAAEPEIAGVAPADIWSSLQEGSSRGSAGASELAKRGTASPDPARAASERTMREPTRDERALVAAVLCRKPPSQGRAGGLDRTLAVLGFASGSMRDLRRRRQDRRRRERRGALELRRVDEAKPLDRENAQERFARKRATILARDARTPAGVDARDRALADLDMRASYAAWKDAETAKQLTGIRAERADAHEAHGRETRSQLQRAWEVERLFREALRSVGIRGAEARRAMAEAYEVRRSAILSARQVLWAALDAVSPEVKAYADWLTEQSGVVADRARAQFEADSRFEAAKRGTVDVDHPVQVMSKEHDDPARQIGVPEAEKPAPEAVLQRSDRFGAILDRTDADRPVEADFPTSSGVRQHSDASVVHPVLGMGDGGDEKDRFAAPPQDAVPASTPAATTEAEMLERRPMPIGLSPRDLAMAHIERQRAAAEAATLEAPIQIEAVLPNIAMERLTASTPQRAAAGDRAIDQAPGSPVGVGTAPQPTVGETVPQPTVGETVLHAMTIHPRVAAVADRSDVTLPSVVRAIGGAEADVPTSARPPAIPVPPPRTSAPPVPPARNVEPPASKARVHEAMAPSPSDRSMPMSVPGLPIDGIEIDLTDIDDMEDIEDVLSAIHASAVLPKAPAAPAIPRSPTPGTTRPAPSDAAERVSAVVRPVTPMRSSDAVVAKPSSPASAAVAPGAQAKPSPERPYWDPGHLPSGKRRLAGRFAAYLDQHRDRMSHAARIASLREALGPDAIPLERWVMLAIGGAGRGHADARGFLDQLISLGTKLTANTDKETIGKENEEIVRLGGKPVPVRPPWDPHQGDHASRFLMASFLTARSIGSVDLERAVIFANAKRYKETSAWSAHRMERVWVWADGDLPKARAFQSSQPHQDRLSKHPAAAWGRWLEILQSEYRGATGKELFDGGGKEA